MKNFRQMLKRNDQFRCYLRTIVSLACGMFSVMMADDFFPELGYKVFLPIGIALLIITNVVIELLARR